MDSRLYKGSFNAQGTRTQTLGTPIICLCPPKANAYTRLLQLVYESAGTAHTVSVLRAQNKVLTSAAASAGQANLTLTDVSTIKNMDGSEATENLAANDILVWKHADGSYGFGLVSSVNTTTKVVTMAANLDKAVASGAPVWKMHEPSRSPAVSGIHAIDFLTKASTANTFGGVGSADHSIASSLEMNSPLIVYSANGTAAGVLRDCFGVYAASP